MYNTLTLRGVLYTRYTTKCEFGERSRLLYTLSLLLRAEQFKISILSNLKGCNSASRFLPI